MFQSWLVLIFLCLSIQAEDMDTFCVINSKGTGMKCIGSNKGTVFVSQNPDILTRFSDFLQGMYTSVYNTFPCDTIFE